MDIPLEAVLNQLKNKVGELTVDNAIQEVQIAIMQEEIQSLRIKLDQQAEKETDGKQEQGQSPDSNGKVAATR